MPSQFNDLPHEVVQLIFTLINPDQYATLRSVNTAWNTLLSPHVFNSVTIFNYFRKERTLDSILDDIECSFAENYTTSGIPIGHHIQQLSLLYDDTSGDQLHRLSALCPNITSFTITSKIMDILISTPLHSIPNCRRSQGLQQMTQQSIPGVSDARQALLVEFFQSLGGSKMTAFKLEERISYPILANIILPFVSNLVQLDLSSVVYKMDDDDDDDDDHNLAREPFMDFIELMDLIQDNCPRLETLALVKRSFSTVEQDTSIATMDGLEKWVSAIRVWPRLTTLHLKINIKRQQQQRHRQRQWLVPTLLYLAVRLSGLQHLQMTARSYTHDEHHSIFPRDEPLAYALRVGFVQNVRSPGKLRWPYFFAGSLHTISLENIHLGFVERLILFGHDEILEGMTFTPSALQSIQLHDCSSTYERLDDGVVSPDHSFLQYCISRNPLASLKIQECGLFQKHILESLASGTNQLETLILDRHNAIDMELILDRCPHLQHLGLLDCAVYGSRNRTASSTNTPAMTQPTAISSPAPPTSASASSSSAASASASASELGDRRHPLKVLDLGGARVMGTDVFSLVSQRCRQLSVLNLEDVVFSDPTSRRRKISASILPPSNDETKQHIQGPEKRLGNVHISMPYTNLSTLTLCGGALYSGNRFQKGMGNLLLVKDTTTTTTTTTIADHELHQRPAAVWFTLEEIMASYVVVSMGKCSQKEFDNMASLYHDDHNDGGFDPGLDAGESLVQNMKKNGLLTIKCKDIQELVLAERSFYSPFANCQNVEVVSSISI
ncbi:hypothetical protein BCR42DRAFT_401576, partial [Absidia repens]